jgi:hypothetical protein
MRSPEHILRHVVRCDWRCKHCGEVIGSERVAHYGAELPELIKPTWFFAAMTLLDHLRDCPAIRSDDASAEAKKAGHDFSEELISTYGSDFLNHSLIYNWYNEHALIERHFLAQEELE